VKGEVAGISFFRFGFKIKAFVLRFLLRGELMLKKVEWNLLWLEMNETKKVAEGNLKFPLARDVFRDFEPINHFSSPNEFLKHTK
jgi:hypothetical protein